MSKQLEAMRLALEALENTSPLGFNMESDKKFFAAITALRAALAEPEPFSPDWDRIEPLQENLREHMAEIHRLRAALAEPVQEPPCATRECMPSQCPNCVSLQDQNTELDRKLAELEAALRPQS